MKLLGLSSGNRGGSAEILLKAALKAAEEEGATVELVRVDDLELSLGPSATSSGAPDDGQWFWDRLMESNGLIVSAPIYTRTIPGKLRLLGDKISGPQADVAFTAELLRMRDAGEPIPVQFAIDERVLRPRVGGFISVGGSIPGYWKTLALPLMHTLTASMQLAVVDQVQFAGAGSPSSIVLDPAAIDRAAQLGRAVASQLGRSWDEAEYLGDPGLCPMCHLDVITIVSGGIECATCGAHGRFVVTDGAVGVEFPAEGLRTSILSLEEKYEHFAEVQQTAAKHAPYRAEIDAAAADWAAWDRTITPR
ncbi:MAG: Multimeric flavodoxin WrbA [Microbacteriaceae bacterium]|jgi:multimeric flavodoxin WrbA|nr:Multimeric flavodoxin WrbA [Microbacteriaceae bacterium]